MTFRIIPVELGDAGNPHSCIVVEHKHQRIEFRGDAYWQWLATPERVAGYCWSQALHDALEGWHATIIHTGDEFVVLRKHPDYAAVAALWARASA